MKGFMSIVLILTAPALLTGCWVTNLFSVRKPNSPHETQAVHRYPVPPRPPITTDKEEPRVKAVVRPTLFNYEVAWSARTEQFVLTTTPPGVRPLERAHSTRLAVAAPRSISRKVKRAHKSEPETRPSRSVHAAPEAAAHKEIIHFHFGSSAIRPPEKKRIGRIAARIKKQHGRKVSVTGYTCWIGPTDVNDKLALARAMAVVHELGRHGVKVGSVSARGKCCYIDLKHPAPNRRAEITWKGGDREESLR